MYTLFAILMEQMGLWSILWAPVFSVIGSPNKCCSEWLEHFLTEIYVGDFLRINPKGELMPFSNGSRNVLPYGENVAQDTTGSTFTDMVSPGLGHGYFFK